MEERGFLAVLYSVLLLSGRTLGFVETTLPNDYMICRPMSNIFGALAGGNSTADKGLLPALQGARGPDGPHGKTGLPGPRGEPNYQKVSTIVEEKMQSINARIFKLESELVALKASGGGGGGGGDGSTYVPTTQSPNDLKYAADCFERFKAPIHKDDMCYSVIGGVGLLWTFDAAESNCTKLGGYLADIDSRELYNNIYDYVDRTYSTVVQAWTGMRYENDELLRTDGEVVKFAKWMAYNPRKSRSSYSTYYRTYTYVYANMDTSSRIAGLQNSPPTRKLPYALCHFYVGNSTTTRRSTTKQTTTTKKSLGWDSDYYDYD